MKYTIIAIMGKAGTGKDTLAKALLNHPIFKDAKPIVSCTTRPIREYEVDGVDYHFITVEEFTNKLLNNEMLEATVFNNWHYGTSIEHLDPDNVNIGVFNPEGCEALRENRNIKLSIIYLEATNKTRLLRQLNREVNPDCNEIIRRFSTDEMDFCEDEIEYLMPDLFITNNEGANMKHIADVIAKTWADGLISSSN